MLIHPTAIVDPSAQLDSRVQVSAYAVIGAGVEIGAGTSVGPHAVIQGPMRMGCENRIHAHACLGDAPQDSSYKGEPTRLEIGDRNSIREFVSIHRGSVKGGGLTRIGSDNMLMAYSHVAHDCRLGHRIIMANGATLGGHVEVGDAVNIAGLVAVHQFVRIGCHAMVGGGSAVLRDVPPYMMASGNHARLFGLNRRGLQRAGFSAESIHALKQAYRLLYRSGLQFAQACEALREGGPHTPEVNYLVQFLGQSERGFIR
jgi:UDP-N-acetylglucosamine acyltransferase